MIVKRNEHNDEEVIELENGCRFHYLYNFDSLDNMKEKLEEARTAFKNNPSQINRLDMIYQAADYMWAKGEHQEAAEYLKQEIDGTGEVVGACWKETHDGGQLPAFAEVACSGAGGTSKPCD